MGGRSPTRGRPSVPGKTQSCCGNFTSAHNNHYTSSLYPFRLQSMSSGDFFRLNQRRQDLGARGQCLLGGVLQAELLKKRDPAALDPHSN